MVSIVNALIWVIVIVGLASILCYAFRLDKNT